MCLRVLVLGIMAFMVPAIGRAALIVLIFLSHAYGQSVAPLVDEGVKLRIEQQELKHLERTRQIEKQEYQLREKARWQRDYNFRQRLARLPKDQQLSLQQQITNRYAINVLPLQQKWDAEARSLKEQDRALAQKHAKEMETDAPRAAELQATRSFLQRQLQQGAITSDEARAKDASSVAEITRLQNKYVAYGDPWPNRFNIRVAQLAAQLVRTQDIKERVADTTSEVGKDAHRAGEIFLTIKRNEMRRTAGAITAAANESEYAALIKELNNIKAKYAAGGVLAALRSDFEERYMHLGERAVAQHVRQWDKEASEQVAASRAAANDATAKQTSAAPRGAIGDQVVAPRPLPTARTSEFLKKMPAPDRVIADSRGSDQLDTAARQVAALNLLKDAVIVLSGTADMPGGPQLTIEEKEQYGRYDRAATLIFTKVYESVDPGDKERFDTNSRRNHWNRLRDKYGGDEAFISALLQRYLPPDLSEAYLRPMRQRIQADALRRQASAQRQQIEEQRQRKQWWTDILGAIPTPIMWAAGLAIILFAIVRMATTAKTRREERRLEASKLNNQNALAQFGTTKDEISRNIESAFDKRRFDVKFELNVRSAWDNSPLKCLFSRSISAMSSREREILRAAYHLYNLELFGTEDNFLRTRFSLIYGDGKATILGDYKFNLQTFRSISDALKSYQGAYNSEAAINHVLSHLQGVLQKNSDDPILRKLSSRLHGDGADLIPGAPLKSGAKGEPVEGGLILGLDEKATDTWWYYDGEGSLITVAPPGSGKTQSQVLPNLLMWKGAAVVLDVKGEIYEQTSKWRQKNVGPVYKFSPLDPASSHGYNPLTLVRADPEYLWEDARFLADMMIVPSGAKDPFWESRARDVLTAAIARTCLEEDVAKRSMGDVLDILHGVGWDKFVTFLEAKIDIRTMSRAGHSLASMEPKTRDGVLQSALSSMSAWDGERLSRATFKSDWSPLDLIGDKHPTIYICLKPNEIDSYISILRVIIAQHIRALTSTKVPSHGVHPILFVLDELPRLRYMPPVEEALEIGRQYGIKLWLFAQSLGQLSEAYPNADGMIGGCAIRMFMNPSLHDETAQKVSDDIGFQESVIDGTRVKVVEPNVLSGPAYKDLVIVMAANAHAARVKKFFIFTDEILKARMGSV